MKQDQPNTASAGTCKSLILASGFLICMLLTVITWIGPSFQYDIRNADRPIALVTSLYVASSLVALFALWIATRAGPSSRDLVLFIFLFSIAFRVIQLFSPPFQEIDNYRYIWDGIVVSKGYSPYHFSPSQVLNSESEEPELNALKQLAFRSNTTAAIVSRIHYAEIRTIYPPVSQAVFAAAMLFVPTDASIATYVFAMKVAITLFDLGTLFLLAYLLIKLKLSLNWCLAYGWNPLILKEFSNSGHLDSIAVFMAMVALTFLVQAFTQSDNRQDPPAPFPIATNGFLCLAGFFLGLGFGAKLYPVILAPFLISFILKKWGWIQSIYFALAFCITSIIVFSPMVLQQGSTPENFHLQNDRESQANAMNQEGLTTFLKHWQVNELAYMLIYQNLRDLDPETTQDRPWFRIQNEPIRQSIVGLSESLVGKDDSVHFLSRFVTLGSFFLFYLGLTLVTWQRSELSTLFLLESSFWIIAVFFCLQPTQNPWYWTWAIPLLPFVRNRAWMIYSTFLFAYYLRFWFSTFPGEYHFLGFHYTGKGLFDYVFVWLEHAPVFAAVFSWHFFSVVISQKTKRDFTANRSIDDRPKTKSQRQ